MHPAPDDARLAPAERRSLVAVFAIALVVRAAYLLSIERAYFFHHPLTEAARYGDWALAVVHGTAPLRPPLDEAIGYPYLVAALFRLFGPDAGAVAVAHALLDACTCVAVAWVARRLVEREPVSRRRSPRSARRAGGSCACRSRGALCHGRCKR